MVESSGGQLKAVAVTTFKRSAKDGQWYWHTRAANGEPVGDGAEGYKELRKAVKGFCAQQGISEESLTALGGHMAWVKVSNREWQFHKYAADASASVDSPDVITGIRRTVMTIKDDFIGDALTPAPVENE